MEIHGNLQVVMVRKLMEIHENFMEINGHSWKFQKKYGNSTKFLEIHGKSMEI